MYLDMENKEFEEKKKMLFMEDQSTDDDYKIEHKMNLDTNNDEKEFVQIGSKRKIGSIIDIEKNKKYKRKWTGIFLFVLLKIFKKLSTQISIICEHIHTIRRSI